MKRSHPTKKRAKKATSVKKTSTALARRSAPQPLARVDVLPPAGTALPLTMLGEDAMLGGLGLSELKLTDKEEAVLSQPIDETQVLIKPTGQVYFSHPFYTRLFHKAFGRTGWALVPVAKPARSDRGITCPYILRVHGVAVAFAWGEQDYFEGNREQSYGDALEATFASALRRCAKRLGIGLELWDKEWGNRFMAANGVCVAVVTKRDGQSKTKYQWRRRTDAPFYNEISHGKSTTPEGEDVDDDVRAQAPEPAQRRAAPPAPPASTSTPRATSTPASSSGGDWQDALISDKQRKRLYMIVKNSGRNEATVKAWLHDRYGLESSQNITRRDYDAICAAVEADGTLPKS